MYETLAHAKINLFLEITGRRSDGYHTVDTVMQEISIADKIAVKLLPKSEGIIIKTDIDSIPTDERNIAYKAARRFFDRISADCGAEIVIAKSIPHEAGMGGGSSDGAAVLKALNELCGNTLSIVDLHDIAAGMGADVPFFLYGGTAHMQGIGTEYVTSIPTPKLDLVVAKPMVGISTPAAYKYLDEIYSGFVSHDAVDSQHIIKVLSAGDIREISECFFNRFEIAADELCPQTRKLRLFMRDHSYGSLLSGSGAAVFAVADSHSHALKLKEMVSKEFPAYYVCVTKTV